MWLLHTTTFVLRKFVGPSYPPYAILSHRWQAEDQTYSFQSVRAVSAQSETPGQGPALSFPGKVRNFCALAANECYEWAWLDTCCIDKTSSAELSEATNSMYAWYEAADICYVYLFDVCDEDNPFDKDSHFRKSGWRKRGWTLQELLAPKNVVFLSKSWYLPGTLPILATLLAEITGVDLPMLHQKLHGWRTNTGVAQRMSWAARRTTSRPEDRAYSLMGIFGVSMPVIYGEGGERAFLRLQKEIINVCPDQSIFAWGPIDPDFDAAVEYLQRDDRDWGEHMYAGDHRLLATSPDVFKFAADFRPLALSRYFQLLGHRPDYNYGFDADGITLRLPISSDCLRCHSQAVYAAALACTTATNEDILVFLFLGREVDSALQEWTFDSVGRLVGLDKYVELTRNMWDTVPRMRGAMLRLPRPELAYTSLRELRIRPPDTVGPIRTDHLKQLCGVYLFEIPHWFLSHMKDRYGFAVPDTELAAHLVSGRILYTLPTSALYPYLDAHRFLSIPFINAARNEALLISFGLGCLCLPLHKSKLDTLDHRAWWLEASLVPGVPTELPQHAQVPETPRSRSPTPTDELEKPFFRHFNMRFTAVASIVLAAGAVGLVNAATLEQRQLGSCSTSVLGDLKLPLCGAIFGDCTGDGCECTELTTAVVDSVPGLSSILSMLNITGTLDLGDLGLCTSGDSAA
ncbi:hypothetical protein DICSQDRAFT_169653 [Dichomitus squalens LYAD-421 SS1]|uniref:Uncharacterized protein n=2 Tax=Dichomitus squalens TaxID=114155 RepID=R7T256_DICSQ|nr:uncharacterized protein DICSQDRAFT_169653 [Dichomitus squalens LYAD-421 SS1]EJF62075.1 hypothetical protein DICSQDRAFT_169653 [Dichomitus squalens LYAD-421 SS1]